MNSGKTYEIRHPELIRVGRSMMHIYRTLGAPDDPFDTFDMVSLLLIESVEKIEVDSVA